VPQIHRRPGHPLSDLDFAAALGEVRRPAHPLGLCIAAMQIRRSKLENAGLCPAAHAPSAAAPSRAPAALSYPKSPAESGRAATAVVVGLDRALQQLGEGSFLGIGQVKCPNV